MRFWLLDTERLGSIYERCRNKPLLSSVIIFMLVGFSNSIVLPLHKEILEPQEIVLSGFSLALASGLTILILIKNINKLLNIILLILTMSYGISALLMISKLWH